MAKYKVFNNGETINTIVADKAFASIYAEMTGYTLEEVVEIEPKPEVPITERLTALEESLALTDEAAIELYEAQMIQDEINAAQDDALIELYEMIGG